MTTDSRSAVAILRAAALVALVLGAGLLLGSWDGLYDAVGLPQGLPALTTQLGGAGFVGLAYVMWASASRPELLPVGAVAGAIAEGGAAIVIAAWLLFRDKEELYIDSSGETLLAVIAVVLGAVALALAWAARGTRGR